MIMIAILKMPTILIIATLDNKSRSLSEICFDLVWLPHECIACAAPAEPGCRPTWGSPTVKGTFSGVPIARIGVFCKHPKP